MKQLTWLSLDELQKKLGEGKKSTGSNGEVQYDWTCSQDSANSLTVTMGADGKIATLKGSYSDEKGADHFSNRMSEEKILEQRIEEFTINYNQYFKSNAKTFDQIKLEALDKVKTFYNAVRNCTPGTYQYMVQDLPGTVFYTSVIKGNQNGGCLIESTMQVPGKVTGKKTCSYKPYAQLLFSEEQASFDGSGNLVFDATSFTPFQQAEVDSCKYEVKEIKK